MKNLNEEGLFYAWIVFDDHILPAFAFSDSRHRVYISDFAKEDFLILAAPLRELIREQRLKEAAARQVVKE